MGTEEKMRRGARLLLSVGYILYFLTLAFLIYSGFFCGFIYNSLGLFVALLVGLAAIGIVMLPQILAHNLKEPEIRKMLAMVFVLYIVIMAILLFGTRYSFAGKTVFASSEYMKHNFNFLPFSTLVDNILNQRWLALFGNVFLFVPAGVLLPIIYKKQQNTTVFLITLLIASIGIEITQLLTGLGALDIDDILCYLVGGVIGYYVVKSAYKRKKG